MKNNNLTITELFEFQVKNNPDKPAVVVSGKSLTFLELDKKSNKIARLLREKGVVRESIVAIICSRSIDIFPLIIGVIKSGGAYLLLDPSAPVNRIKIILEDSNTKIVLTDNDELLRLHYLKLLLIDATDHKVIKTEPRAQIIYLDDHPLPDRSSIDYSEYHKYIGQGKHLFRVNLQATRGCPYNCAYCHKIWPKNHVYRSAEHIYNEIQNCYKAGVRKFVFIDDIFNLNVKNSAELLRMIVRDKLDISLAFPNGLRVDILEKWYIDLLVEAGMDLVALPLESGSSRIQKLIRKNLDIERFEENVQYIINNYPNVVTNLFVILGFPTETEADIQKTIDFIYRQKWLHFPFLFILKIYPNTDMYNLAISHGISKESIMNSIDLAFHEIPETVQVPKQFIRKVQSDYMSNYFMNKERLKAVLPIQRKGFNDSALIQDYNNYIPSEIKTFDDIFDAVGINPEEVQDMGIYKPNPEVFSFTEKIKEFYPKVKSKEGAVKILFLDVLFFPKDDQSGRLLIRSVDEPLGFMYLLSYLNKELPGEVDGKICKAVIDFSSIEDLYKIVTDFNPDIIAWTSFSIFKSFFHYLLYFVKIWMPSAVNILGGPYATSEYETALQDKNLDLVVIGEGEVTFCEVVKGLIAKGKDFLVDGLTNIPGVAFSAVSAENREVLSTEDIIGSSEKFSDEPFNIISKPEDLIYLVYTSGTTGVPKGVMIEHGTFAYVTQAWASACNLYYDELSLLQLANTTFDVFSGDLARSIFIGGKCVMCSEDERQDISKIYSILQSEKVTFFESTPSFVLLLMDFIKRKGLPLDYLKTVILGADKCKLDDFKVLVQDFPEIRFINGYGTTEVSITSCLFDHTKFGIPEKGNLPVGVPFEGTEILILNNDKKIVETDEVGEIYIGGQGVGRGYLNRLDETNNRFVQDPAGQGEDSIYYRTGDLGKWLSNGTIEFLGRNDSQVKIRGYRIECSEIESQMLKHPLVKQAEVVVKKNGEQQSLFACYVAKEALEHNDLKSFLSKVLPEYMVPGFYKQLENMPLTPNGKIDRTYLARLSVQIAEGGIETVAPRNVLEKEIVAIWEKILGQNEIGINQSFIDLGGDSLHIFQLLSRLNDKYNVKLKFTDIFNLKTIENLSAYISKEISSDHEEITPLGLMEHYSLSSSQIRFYMLEKFDEKTTHYNSSTAIRIVGKIDVGRVEETIKRLIKRHESLRTYFVEVDGTPVMKITEDVNFKLEYMEMDSLDIDAIMQKTIRHFDVASPLLFRAGLVKITEEEHVIWTDMSHIIGDGVSVAILASDFVSMYSNVDLPKQTITYKDYAVWQLERLSSPEIQEQKKYWVNKYSNTVPVINLPCDYSRPVKPNFQGKAFIYELSSGLTSKIKDFSKNNGVTDYMLLMTGFYSLLYRYTSQEDIIIGFPIANRPIDVLKDLIGNFINTITVRCFPKASKSFLEFLKEVSSELEQVYNNHEYPFEDLVKSLNLTKDTSRNPLFDVLFVMQDIGFKKMAIEGLLIDRMAYKRNVSKLDLCIYVEEIDDKFAFYVEFATSLFAEVTIRRLMNNFDNLLVSALDNPELQLSKLRVISKEEESAQLSFTHCLDVGKDSLSDIFRKQVFHSSEKIAIIDGENSYTYKQLDEYSDIIAHFLFSEGLVADDVFAISMGNSFWVVCSMLAGIKAGIAYLPISSEMPLSVMRNILLETKCKIMLTDQIKDDDLETKIVLISKVSSNKNSLDVVFQKVSPNVLAYILYTSGSTGKPKGVMIEQKSLINAYFSWREAYDLTDICLLQLSPYVHDVYTGNWLKAILSGGKLVLTNNEDISSTRNLRDKIIANKVNFLDATPQIIKVLLEDIKVSNEEFSGQVVVGSDVCSKKDYLWIVDNFTNIKLYNSFGTTETTIYNTNFSDKNVFSRYLPIGKALINNRLLVFDDNMNLLPVGCVGELYVGGSNLARGYVNNNELTNQKFVNCPYSGDILYKTGDLVRMLEDGNIEYIGRNDSQIKINGKRIEIEELEGVLSGYTGITNVVALIKNDLIGKKLVVFYESEREISEDLLRKYLKDKLTVDVQPNYFRWINNMPVTSNMKINRGLLFSRMDEFLVKDKEEFVVASSDVEILTQRIWQECLAIENISIESDFFDLGGDSLCGIRLVSRMNAEGFVCTLSDLYFCRTIKSLASFVSDNKDELIRDFGLAEIILGEKFNIEVKFVNNFIDKLRRKVLILQVKEEGFGEKELWDFIHIRFADNLIPEILGNEKQIDYYLNFQVNKDVFYKEILKQVRDEETLFYNSIFQGELKDVTSEFLSMDFNKYYRDIYFLIRIPLDSTVNHTDVNEVIHKMIREQEVLRSFLFEEKGNVGVKVNSDISTISPVVYLDLSQQPLLISDSFYQVLFEYYKIKDKFLSFPFRALFVKKNNRDSELLIFLAEWIHDNTSERIVKSYCLSLICKKGYLSTITPKRSYFDYLIDSEKLDMSDEEIVQSFNLKEFYLATLELNKYLENKKQRRQIVEIELNNSPFIEETMGFNIFIKFIKNFTTITKLPVWYVHDCRDHDDNIYLGSIGGFMDYVPILIDIELDNPILFKDILQEKLFLLKKKAISFSALIKLNDLGREYPVTQKLLRDCVGDLFNSNLVLAYQYITDDSNDDGVELLSKEINKDTVSRWLNSFRFVFTKKGPKKILILDCPFVLSEEEIQQFKLQLNS